MTLYNRFTGEYMTEAISIDQIVQELQMISQQLVSVQTQVRELEGTLNHLSNQSGDNSVYQQVGPILVEVDDIQLLKDSLQQTCEQLSIHAEKLSEREGELREAYEKAVTDFESS